MTKKLSSQMVSLVEELGDARLRCDQLVRYISEGVKIITQSPHKDHLFEEAGHLIQGIPETAFKLQKALQAVALMADRLDYEELKLELRPEKVDELEQVLKDVRLHQVKRRSENNTMTPQQVASQLRDLSKKAKDNGYFPFNEVASLVKSLDPERVTHKVASSSDLLERVAASLETSGDKPNKTQLANLLSRIAMEATFSEALSLVAAEEEPEEKDADKAPTSKEASLLAKAESLANRIAGSNLWMYTDEEGKDFYLATKRKGTIKSPYTGTSFTADPKRATMSDVGKELKEDQVKIKGTLWKYVDSDEKEFYLPERLTTTLRSPFTGRSFKPKAERFSLTEVSKDIKDKKASDDDERRSRFEEGVPADPTENMSPEDAAEWRRQHQENKDNFKAAASGDPYWMKAKYPGKAQDGTPFKKGEEVFYYPRTKAILVGDKAEKASKEFDSAKDDERTASNDLSWKA